MQMPVERVTYYHLELVAHDVLLAEGLPTESYLDMRDGSNYANRCSPIWLYPDYAARMWEAFACARLIVTGPELAAARALVEGYAAGLTRWPESTAACGRDSYDPAPHGIGFTYKDARG